MPRIKFNGSTQLRPKAYPLLTKKIIYCRFFSQNIKFNSSIQSIILLFEPTRIFRKTNF